MAKNRVLAPSRPGAGLEPIETDIIQLDEEQSLVIRQWRTVDTPESACRQCTRCTVHPHGPARGVMSCALFVPPEQVHDICFNGARLQVTNRAGGGASARIVGTQPPPPRPNWDGDEAAPSRRPALWGRTCLSTLSGGRSVEVDLWITTRRRWERMAVTDESYSHHWCICSLWASLVLAVRVTTK